MKYLSVKMHIKKCSAVRGKFVICKTLAIIHILGACSWFPKCSVRSTDYRFHVDGKILLYSITVGEQSDNILLTLSISASMVL